MNRGYTVKVAFDKDAEVWFTDETDVPGLSAEDDNLQILFEKIKTYTATLLEARGAVIPDRNLEVPITLLMSHQVIVSVSENRAAK